MSNLTAVSLTKWKNYFNKNKKMYSSNDTRDKFILNI